MSHGPLTDVRVVEVAGIGPGPFGGDDRHPLNLDGADVEGLAATRVIARGEEGA